MSDLEVARIVPLAEGQHATCSDCEQEMNPGVGCTFTHVSKTEKGTPVARVRVGQWTDWGAPICHDCNAGEGQIHHSGCDTERCPECGSQMLMCAGPADEYGGCGWEFFGIVEEGAS